MIPCTRALCAGMLACAVACGPTRQPPTTPTSSSTSSATTTTTSVPPAGQVTLDMPIEPGDRANASFGLNAFGIHFGGTSPGGHGLDGHPGWDVEYRIGGTVRSAAAGVVQSVLDDVFTPGRFTIQIQHPDVRGTIRTVYTNVTDLAAGVARDATVAAGQPLGLAGSQTVTTGTTSVTYAMTHFQLDDFTRSDGMTNPNAINPEERLGAGGRALFDQIWRTAVYNVEITEPFPGNVRNASFPFTRSWTLESGALPPRIDFTRLDPASTAHEYALLDANGAAIERGAAAILVRNGLLELDLKPTTGATRLALADIVGDRMTLDLSAPGGARPADLSRASVFRTR